MPPTRTDDDVREDKRTAEVRALEAHAALKRLAERAPATDEVRGLIATVGASLPDVDNPESIPPAPLAKTDAQLEQELARVGVEQSRLDSEEARRQTLANAAATASEAALSDTSDGIVATAPTPISGEQIPSENVSATEAGTPGDAPLADTSDGVNATAPGSVSGDTTQTDATAADLDAMSKDELLAEAERRGVDVPSSATKAEIREAIDAA